MSATEDHPYTDGWVTFMWLADALDGAHAQGQEKLVSYLEAVLEEVLLEEG